MFSDEDFAASTVTDEPQPGPAPPNQPSANLINRNAHSSTSVGHLTSDHGLNSSTPANTTLCATSVHDVDSFCPNRKGIRSVYLLHRVVLPTIDDSNTSDLIDKTFGDEKIISSGTNPKLLASLARVLVTDAMLSAW